MAAVVEGEPVEDKDSKGKEGVGKIEAPGIQLLTGQLQPTKG